MIGHSLFKAQIAEAPAIEESLQKISDALISIPAQFRSAVPSDKLKTAFSRTGLSLESNQRIFEFIASSRESLSVPIAAGDWLTFSHLAFEFFLQSEMREMQFTGVEYFQELSEISRASLLESWLLGDPISKILSGTELGSGPIDPDRMQRLLSQGLTYRYPWGVSSVLQIFAAILDVELDSWPEAIRMTPTYFKFGVSTPKAALFLNVGIPSRILARRLGNLVPDGTPSECLSWLRNVSSDELRAERFSDRDIQAVIEIASKLSRTNVQGDEWSFDVKGTTYGDGRKQSSLIISQGQEVKLVREAQNQFDPFAIRVLWDQVELGYVPRNISRSLSSFLDLEEGQVTASISGKAVVSDWARLTIRARLNRN